MLINFFYFVNLVKEEMEKRGYMAKIHEVNKGNNVLLSFSELCSNTKTM